MNTKFEVCSKGKEDTPAKEWACFVLNFLKVRFRESPLSHVARLAAPSLNLSAHKKTTRGKSIFVSDDLKQVDCRITSVLITPTPPPPPP